MKLIVIGGIALTFGFLGKRVDHLLKKSGLKANFHEQASVYIHITGKIPFFSGDND